MLAADAPAQGASSGTRTNELDFVELVQHFAERFGPLRAAVGHSLGAAAIAMTLAQGASIECAALVAPTARLIDELGKFARLARLSEGLTNAIERHARIALVDDLWERTRLASIAPRIAIDTLVVHDEHDPDVPFTGATSLAAALPHGELFATRGLGHFVPLRARAVIERVVEHVAG